MLTSHIDRFCVYMITNRWRTVLYVGVTGDIRKRIFEHQRKLMGGFSAKYNLDRLVYMENFSDIRFAIAREKEIKGWRREKKIKLVETLNPEWKDLAVEYGLSEGDPSLRSGW